VNLSKHILDYRKKQTRTLLISENITFTNDDVMNYVIRALQKKLPRAPLPFNRLCLRNYTHFDCPLVYSCCRYDSVCRDGLLVRESERCHVLSWPNEHAWVAPIAS